MNVFYKNITKVQDIYDDIAKKYVGFPFYQKTYSSEEVQLEKINEATVVSPSKISVGQKFMNKLYGIATNRFRKTRRASPIYQVNEVTIQGKPARVVGLLHEKAPYTMNLPKAVSINEEESPNIQRKSLSNTRKANPSTKKKSASIVPIGGKNKKNKTIKKNKNKK